ncbi:piezo-type mechanosensitive ion channel component 1-like [Sorex araneus]|uniref:piezo-type mechanosensitive ion channel component 1-like n=1 Tax=Sorex araneus TaxID=42254 RepID=UPI0024338D56|nr:piezo-type mechanosensitive ion channel component 1-like [Sorex araneus]
MDKIKAKQKKIEEQQAGRVPEAAAAGGSCRPREGAEGVVQDGSYSLFETDSEEEEAAEGSDVEAQEQRPKPKTAFQLAHDAWTNSSRSALRMRRRDEGCMDRADREADEALHGGPGGTGPQHDRGWATRGGRGAERPAPCEMEDAEAGDEDGEEPGSLPRRLLYMAQFSWVLGKVLLDDLTETLHSMCRNHANVAVAFREQRSAWWRAGKRTMSDGPAGLCPALARDAQPATPLGGQEGPESPAPPPAGVQLLDMPALEEAGGHAPTEELEEPLKDGVGGVRPPGSPLPPETRRPERDLELEHSDRFFRRLPRLIRLAMALYQFLESRTELLCYFVIILNHTLSASILSMVLPILSFLWAMLSNPRPSRRFWMLAVYYTEAPQSLGVARPLLSAQVTVLVKYLSQFGFLPWTTKRYAGISREKPYSLPNIVGIEKKDGYALCDLLQLLVLFFHRATMKGLGLWDQKPPGKASGKAKKKSRRLGRRAGKGTPEGDPLSRQALLGPASQGLPPAAPRWAFWRRKGQQAAASKVAPVAPGPAPGQKPRSLCQRLRKFPLRQKLSRKMLKKLLIIIRKMLTRRALQVYRPIRQFFFNLTHPLASSRCDVYAITFLVEALNFAIVLLGYEAFGKKMSAEDLAESLSEEKVPEAFLAMVLIQFGTMVVDRALYLQKTLFGKCLFQVILVVGTHFWVFFILPGVTERRFSLNWVAQVWYLVKCVYFALSAYQIKCGYPTRILGNFLTKGFNLVNLMLFKGFRFIPFLLELRAVIGWMWTDTALSLSNWICLEDIYANIFIMKCWQESEKKYPQPPGRKKKKVVKYGVGGVITFALVFLMWFPLVFMSLLKTVGGVTNQPLEVSIKIAINGYETLFTMTSQQQNLIPFSEAAYDQLTQQYALHSSAMQFLANYKPEDIVLVKIKSHASLLWSISPANRAAMIRELANTSIIYFTTSWTVKRNVSLVENVEASGKHSVYYTSHETRDHLVQMLTHTRKEPVMLPGLIPKALKTTAGTEAKLARQLQVSHSQRPQDVDRLAFFRNATVRLQELKPVGPPEASLAVEWWVVQEWWPGCDHGRGCSRDLELVIYNDKVSPQSMGFLAGYGIVGLYVSVVMVAAKFIREHFLGISRSIMFEELPCVDRIFRLCTDIFLVRELGELELEQQLFSKLIFLYRSPETMIKWTRDPPEPPAPAPRRPLPPEPGAPGEPRDAAAEP